MSLNELMAFVPPPKTPRSIGSARQWQQAEAKLGVVLPDDYRKFVHTYGGGLFAGFYYILTPGTNSQELNLIRAGARISELLQTCEDLPFAVHPVKPGLLLWGHDENGNNYYWLTKGSPAKWWVVTEEVRGDGFVTYRYSMVEYLLRVQKRKIPALAVAYPPLKMRCPVESCPGWAEGAYDDETEWQCGECGGEWAGRGAFEQEIMNVISKHPHRRKCYFRKRGRYYPAPRECEPKDYVKLVRREIDD